MRNTLGRKLKRRPSATSLVELNILPEECARKGGNAVAPGLVERRRRVIKESLKDGLRVWVERRAILVQRRKEEGEKERLGVKGLVRRFTRKMLEEKGVAEAGINGLQRQKRKAQARWGREAEVAKRWEEERSEMLGGGCSQPTRAHVLGLKKFWEGVTKAAAG